MLYTLGAECFGQLETPKELKDDMKIKVFAIRSCKEEI